MIKIGEAKSLIREVPLIEIGVPNSLGNVYTKRSADKIFEIFNDRRFFTGELVDVLLDNGEYVTKLEENNSHIIDHLFIEDDFIIAVVKFSNSRKGKEALKIFSDGLAIFRPSIRGKIVDETSEIVIIDIIGVDLIPINDKLLQKEFSWITVK